MIRTIYSALFNGDALKARNISIGYLKLLKENHGNYLATDRPYWQWYINEVAVAEDKSKPFQNLSNLDVTPFSHLKSTFPPANDHDLAPKMNKFLGYIMSIIGVDGQSKYTVAEILNGLPQQKPTYCPSFLQRVASRIRGWFY
jgi:hypothetical protein